MQKYPGLELFHCCAHCQHLAAEDTIKYKDPNQLKKAENVLLACAGIIEQYVKANAKADLSFDQVEPGVLGWISGLKALKDSNTIEQIR
ncbi:MAG: hypothetical protein EZS28_051712 [Streblomastix strix]|uniref:DUF4371 domain-containing protein n=1 Tax=Streblomastix strix TaxID=222440 RepID=A0A5J4T4S3_9EUKA|nr:MAG: hypothetical protein EZS28_051712 [Streblomastix strix]